MLIMLMSRILIRTVYAISYSIWAYPHTLKLSRQRRREDKITDDTPIPDINQT